MRRNNKGFTLIEVMIALAIFAAMASAIVLANVQALRSAIQIDQQVQARWINQNVLTQMRLEHSLPDAGKSSKPYEYNGQEWVVDIEVSNADMEVLGPFLRHIELKARLKSEDTPADVLIAILGEAKGK